MCPLYPNHSYFEIQCQMWTREFLLSVHVAISFISMKPFLTPIYIVYLTGTTFKIIYSMNIKTVRGNIYNIMYNNILYNLNKYI